MSYELTPLQKTQSILKQLFRSDSADLDFGIFRIMNMKREQIEQFIDTAFVEITKSEFKKFAESGTEDLKIALTKLRQEINNVIPETIDNDFNVLNRYPSPKLQEFETILSKYKDASVSETGVNEVFNHISEFFSRYFEDGDFIPKSRFSGTNKYFFPYNGEEVLLYWATRDMYYIKSDEFYKKYTFASGRFQVTFNVIEAEVNAGNTKGKKKYFIISQENPVLFDESSGNIEIQFVHRTLDETEQLQSPTQDSFVDSALQTIVRALEKTPACSLTQLHANSGKSVMRKYLESYVRKNTKDFFIHKNIKRFLLTELNSYLNSEVLAHQQIGERNQEMINAKLKAINSIAIRIIDFLGQIEGFQKSLFEKRKFVLNTDYCMTLDKVPIDFYEEIGKNKRQIQEWKHFFKLDTITKGSFYDSNKVEEFTTEYLKHFPNLVLDTSHFDELFKWRLLSSIENLEDNTVGTIIKSDNYQCLNLLSRKYFNQIGGIYIDPPYNTGKDGFLYKDQFFHSSWLTMIGNTAALSRDLLTEQGVFLCSIGNHELHRLTGLLQDTYGETNFLGPFIWVNEGNIDNQKKIKQNHEYVLAFAKDVTKLPYPTVIDPNIPKDSKLFKDTITNTIVKNGLKNPISEITLPIGFSCELQNGNLIPNKVQWPKFDEVIPVKDGKITKTMKIRSGWSSKELLEEYIANGLEPIIDTKDQKTTFKLTKDGVPYIVKERSEKQGHVLTVLENVGSTQSESSKIAQMGIKFSYPKPTALIKYLISALTTEGSVILDYFAGSGPVAQAILELNADNRNRKYLLVDMETCFEDILKCRIKKIMFSKEWKDGIPVSNAGYSHILKYQYLEQYEDTLNNIELSQKSQGLQTRLDGLQDYFLKYMLTYESEGSTCRFSFEKFKKPFEYKMQILGAMGKKEQTIDLVETFNYLLGLKVSKLELYTNGQTQYRVVRGSQNKSQIIVVWRDYQGINLKADADFINKTIVANNKYDYIFVNGDSFVKDAIAIETEFKDLMEEQKC